MEICTIVHIRDQYVDLLFLIAQREGFKFLNATTLLWQLTSLNDFYVGYIGHVSCLDVTWSKVYTCMM